MLKKVSLIFSLLLLTVNVIASDYYQVQVDVADNSAASRLQVLSKAFNQVLIKAAGTRKVLQANPQAHISDTEIQNSLESYSYAQQGPRLLLQCHFQAATVNRVLNKLNIPVWTKNRPQVLAWLYLAPEGIVSELTPKAQATLQQQARQRGLDLLMPLLDLEDRQHINAEQVAKPDREALIKASQRYRPNVILNAHIRPQAGQFSGTWHIYVGKEDITWTKAYPSVGLLLKDSIHIITDTLASRYSTPANQTSQSNSIVIKGIYNLKDYVALQKFLQSRAEISQVQITQAKGDSLSIELNTAGGQTGLARVLRAGGLRAVSTPSNDQRPHYQWQP